MHPTLAPLMSSGDQSGQNWLIRANPRRPRPGGQMQIFRENTVHVEPRGRRRWMMVDMRRRDRVPLVQRSQSLRKRTTQRGSQSDQQIKPLFRDGWTYQRIDVELAEAKERYEHRSQKASHANAVRWRSPGDRKAMAPP